MPTLNLSELNVVVAVLGSFAVIFGIISVKLKQAWYLGEALPAMLIGIALGPVGANFLNPADWGSAEEGQVNNITLGVTRVVICVQLVIAGYQLPQKYAWYRWKEVFICLIPLMALMWLLTTACFLATVPKITFLAGLAIAASCTCTDPILSQAVAKGPFADKYVARNLREIISAEALLNDGFAFPFLTLAIYLLRHADYLPSGEGYADGYEMPAHELMARAGGEVGRVGGGIGIAMKNWFLETWLYTILLSVVYGAVVGFGACRIIKFALSRKWIDSESYVLFPAALGLFTMGTCGAIGTNDILASAVSGCALNWDGAFLEETERRHDEVNTCLDVILNFGGFMYIGTIIPWSGFHDPDGTGLTVGRLFLLGVMIFAFRRIPALFMCYKFMPKVVANWKDALFMGYFGPIGIGAVFYVEHTFHIIPREGEADDEFNDMIRVLSPTIHFLVVFSIIGHGLSIPLLNLIYQWLGVRPIQEDGIAVRRKSIHMADPVNAVSVGDEDTYIAYNRFRRPSMATTRDQLPLTSLDLQRDQILDRISLSRAAVEPPKYEVTWRGRGSG